MLKNFNSILNFQNKDTRIYLIMSVIIFVSIFLAKANRDENSSGLKILSGKNNLIKADSLVAFAKSLIGKKYCYASCSPNPGFDCSGYVYYIFSHFGITLPRSSYLMADIGQEIDLKDCQKGDLIFFTGTDPDSEKVGHVGIIISNKDQPIEFIHSSSGKNSGVIITPMSSTHYQKRFVKVTRVLL